MSVHDDVPVVREYWRKRVQHEPRMEVIRDPFDRIEAGREVKPNTQKELLQILQIGEVDRDDGDKERDANGKNQLNRGDQGQEEDVDRQLNVVHERECKEDDEAEYKVDRIGEHHRNGQDRLGEGDLFQQAFLTGYARERLAHCRGERPPGQDRAKQEERIVRLPAVEDADHEKPVDGHPEQRRQDPPEIAQHEV